MSKYVRLNIDQVKAALSSAFHYANRQMKIADSEQFERMIQSLRSNQTQMVPMFKIATTKPPYEPGRTVVFDVWGRHWVARTDSFEWERFPACYMEPESIAIGSKKIIAGLPKHASGYFLEYWSPIATPVEIEADDLHLYQYGGP